VSSSFRKAPHGRLGSRRLRALATLLPAGAAGARDVREACAQAAALLVADAELLPYVGIYIRGPGGLELAAGAGAGAAAAESAAAADQALATGLPVRLQAPPAVALPILRRQSEQPVMGVLVAGVDARFAGDPDHLVFLQLVAAQLAAALAGAAWAEEAADLRAEMARTVTLEHLKSDFLRLASHELRGPMAVVRGYLDMVNSGSFGPVPPSFQDVLPIVTGKIDEMNRLVEQLLDSARLDDNRLSLTRRTLDLRQLARQCAEAVAPYSRAGHRLHLRLGTAPVLVDVDRSRISGVITNVIDNAIKYSPGGGDVLVECEADGGGRTATLRVTDSGLGIAEEDLPRLFTRFGRIVTPENSHISGTGLGLYLSREITRMHGGEIRLRSQAGSGTTVEITLPLSSSESGMVAAGFSEESTV
jgi:signal transduction histidine kinase